MNDSDSELKITNEEARKLLKIKASRKLYDAAVSYHRLHMREQDPQMEYRPGKGYFLVRRFPCCKGVTKPTWARPRTEWDHGRSAIHVVREHGVTRRYRDVLWLAQFLKRRPVFATSIDTLLSALAAHEARAALLALDDEGPTP